MAGAGDAAGGLGISLGRLLLALRSVGQLRRTSRPIEDEALRRLADETLRRGGFPSTIELRETSELSGAVTFGWLRPVIVLPEDWRTWSQTELAAAVAHEIAHVARGDYARRLVTLVGAAIHFYHPLVRRAARLVAADQEMAADSLARRLVANEPAYLQGLARLRCDITTRL